MAKKHFTIISIVLVSLALLFLLTDMWYPQTSFEHRQVKKIAKSGDNPNLLDFSLHISEVPRPKEHFKFPIALGQIGPIASLYSGPLQYPFYCMTLDSNLGQPVVDNHQGYGVPIYQNNTTDRQLIGYSKDCLVPSQLRYYRITQNNLIELVDVSKFKNQPLKQQDYTEQTKVLLRVEQGSINRFIYTLIMPITFDEIDSRLAQSQWNKRLIYQFNGGSGIGYRQGRQRPKRVIDRQIQQLIDGYAVVSSSGNRTSYTYNMLLAEDTARRVKRQFISLYGEPLYTVGIGGSGGGLAQYLIAQNTSDILDGIIPLYSYPDMITQTTYALDCDLLNNYFTFRAKDRKVWQDWRRRQYIEGLNGLNNFQQKNSFLQPLNQIFAGFIPSFPEGSNECINGYFGLSSFINNPKQGFIRDFFHPDIVEQVSWSYWQDLVSLLGTDKEGFALSTWDNVGVQYGLSALVNDQITIKEFVDINRKIGGWKAQKEMRKETLLIPFGRKLPLWLSLWSKQNITQVNDYVAKRHEGSIEAMHAAYLTGQVFIGKVDIPILDVRHYLEDDLDMHHVLASFASRLRIINEKGNASNHIIWIANKDYSPVSDAFKAMDTWILTMKQQGLNADKAKPVDLNDSCFAENGEVIDSQKGTWNGAWNGHAPGECYKSYPMFSTSRIQSGANWAGDIFKCQLISIRAAIKRGFYGKHNMAKHLSNLEKIFPTGVCDYLQGDLGRPDKI